MKRIVGVGLFLWIGLAAMSSVFAQTIVIPIKRLPVMLDPQHYEDIYSMVGILQIHRGLMRFKPNLGIETDIAESYKILNGGKTVRFVLAPRLFSNGHQIEAKHVVRTFQRMFKEKGGFSADLDYIVGAKKILEGSQSLSDLGVKEIDSKTVEFTLIRPVGIFFSHLATVDAAILPLSEDLKYDWRKDGGAGPYVVKEMTGRELKLVASKRSISPGMASTVLFREMTDQEALVAAREGGIQSLDGFSLPEEMLAELKKIGWRESVTTLTRQLFLVLNPNRLDVHTRGLVKSVIAKMDLKLSSPSYERAWGLIPTGLAGAIQRSDHSVDVLPHPLSRRKKMSIQIVNAEPVVPHLVEQIKHELAKYNIELSIEEISLDSYLKKIKDRKFDMMIRSKFLDYPDGVSILTYFRSNYSANTFFVADKKVDNLLNKAIAELEADKRANLYRKIQHIILKHDTIIPLVFGTDNVGLWSPKVKFVPAHPLGIQGLPLETIKVAD